MRLAILSTHPIQYHVAWFRALAARTDLEIHVYYCHQATPQEHSRSGFGVEFDWDVSLLDGYPYSFFKNVAKSAGHGSFGGFDTPEVKEIIKSHEFDAVLVNGWHYKSAWQAIYACWQSGVKVMVRGDSHLHTPETSRSELSNLSRIDVSFRGLMPVWRLASGLGSIFCIMAPARSAFSWCPTR